MKILVYEYITGGGLVNEEIPASLAYEGEMMLAALLNDLLEIKNIEVCIIRDARLRLKDALITHAKLSVVYVSSQEQFDQCFSNLIAYCEAVWPIAPETDKILADISTHVEKVEKILLSSTSTAVQLTGNKLITCKVLNENNISVVSSVLADADSHPKCYPVVLKPVDGVGCEESYLISSAEEYQCQMQEHVGRAPMILQPFIAGFTLSLSVLFCNGYGQLVSCNEQKMEILKQQFKLRECRVNIFPDHREQYQRLVEKIALALPELWGYVGIDCVVTPSGPVVLEINPRLTTSYVG